jgi:hypothetical protein
MPATANSTKATGRKDRLVSGRTRPWNESHPVLLTCGHRHYMAEQQVATTPYRFAWCTKCHDTRDFAKRKPSRSRWTGHI